MGGGLLIDVFLHLGKSIYMGVGVGVPCSTIQQLPPCSHNIYCANLPPQHIRHIITVQRVKSIIPLTMIGVMCRFYG